MNAGTPCYASPGSQSKISILRCVENGNWIFFDAHMKGIYTLQRHLLRRYTLEDERLEPTAITHLERKKIFQTSKELCSMLIFRGVFGP